MATIISANGATQYISLRMTAGLVEWSSNQTTWNPIAATANWPATIINTNPGSSTILRVVFTQDLTISNTYGNTSGYLIAGSSYVTIDGSGNTININTITSYPGFINNGASAVNGYSNVIVQNINSNVTGSTLSVSAGWLCQQYFGLGSLGNSVTNCSNNGEVNAANSGGIVGGNSGGGSGILGITNCTSSGTISGQASGGIIGGSASSTGGLVTITNCFSIGDITGQYAGGIAGDWFGYNTSQTCSITSCYSTGAISGSNAGGIVGAEVGFNNNVLYTPIVNITNCYSMGAIALTTGGICGGTEGSTYINTPNVSITNCYSSGLINPLDLNSGIVSTSLQILPNQTDTYAANNNWSDTDAQAFGLTGAPTNITTNNPGATWTTIVSNTPYVLSLYNAQLYSPNNASSFENYTTTPGLIQPGYNYTIAYNIQSVNVATTRVFVYKGTAPYYNTYNFNTFTMTNLNGAIGKPISVAINASSGVLNYIMPYPCFLEGTKILCFENNQEVYRPIEGLRKGDLVKTIYNGFLPIYMIGTSRIYNPGNDYRVTNRLYKCSKEKYPALFEDLYITGCHSILVPSMTDDQWENTKAVNGTIYVTDNHFRLIACADERAEPFNQEGFMNIYHIALENSDYFMNYGIYANGLLVESCSKRYLTEISNMQIMGENDCAVSQDIYIDGVSNIINQLVDTY